MQDFKSLLKAKRAAVVNVTSTLRVFPLQVKDFLSVLPDRYSDSEPPVACRISESVIDELRLMMPARNTHNA